MVLHFKIWYVCSDLYGFHQSSMLRKQKETFTCGVHEKRGFFYLICLLHN